MPLYNYTCCKCKHEEEKIESIHAPLIQDCPKCKELKSLERQLAGVAPLIAFKGKGWYKDGYQK